MRTIEKKVLAQYFEQIISGQITFELRLADWKCGEGDLLVLVEIDNDSNKPTGRTLKRRIGSIVKSKDLNFWTEAEVNKNGYQVMSLLPVSKLPEIRIKDAWLLRENASKHLHELWGHDKTLADDKWMEKRVVEYQKAWRPVEKKILSAMTEMLDLDFRQNIIDVNIAPWFNAFSDPMVIGVMQDPDTFVDTLTHELIHRLLTDNTSVPYETRLLDEWRKMFGKSHSFVTTVHIPVHAVLKAIYLDTLRQPERLERDMANNKKWGATDYLAAWDYVNKHDYKKIISKLKLSYALLGDKK